MRWEPPGFIVLCVVIHDLSAVAHICFHTFKTLGKAVEFIRSLNINIEE